MYFNIRPLAFLLSALLVFLLAICVYGNPYIEIIKSSQTAFNILTPRIVPIPEGVQKDAECVRQLIKTAPNVSPHGTVIKKSENLKEISYSTFYNIAYEMQDPLLITTSEKEAIAAIVQLEVIGKYATVEQFEHPHLKYYEMLAVAQVIRNRLEDIRFPNTIFEIIYSAVLTDSEIVYQFSTSPHIQDVKPSECAYAAVDEVFDNGVMALPKYYLYFCASWHETTFESNNYSVLRFVDRINDFDKIIADATTFYAGS